MIRVPTKIVPCMCALTHAMFSQCQIDNGCECHAAQAFFRNNVFFVEMTQTCVLSTQELPADILSLVRFTFLHVGSYFKGINKKVWICRSAAKLALRVCDAI